MLCTMECTMHDMAACEQPRAARTMATRWCNGIVTASPTPTPPPAVATAGRKRAPGIVHYMVRYIVQFV